MTADHSSLSLRHDISEEAIRNNKTWFIALGVLWLLLGFAAIVLPQIATIAVDLLVGVLLLTGGLFQLVQAFGARGWRGALWNSLIAVLALITGALLLINPFEGAQALALVLAIFFIAGGIFRSMIGVSNRDMPGWGWLLFSGILGIALGLLIWATWPGSGAWVLGLIVGIELIFTGWSMIVVASSVEKIRGSRP